MPVAALAVLLVAICTSKVLSPQFLIWTFPVVALCVAQPRWLPRLAAVAVALATALTQVEFPARYWDLVALDDGPMAILLARNLTAGRGGGPRGGRRRHPAASRDRRTSYFQVVNGVRNA